MEEQIEKKSNEVHLRLINLVKVVVVVAGLLAAYYIFVSKTDGWLDKIFTSKESFESAFGQVVSEERFRRLMFLQKNQVCNFRIVRYRGEDGNNQDMTEYYKDESGKTDVSAKVLMKQRCEWIAQGTFEFNFYIEMSNLSKWDFYWDSKIQKLTLYPPDLGANTPAEVTPLRYTCIEDSVTIDEDYTKEQLEKALPNQKRKLAEDQKRFLYDEARVAIQKHYKEMLALVAKVYGVELEKMPEIEVIFPHEKGKLSIPPLR